MKDGTMPMSSIHRQGEYVNLPGSGDYHHQKRSRGIKSNSKKKSNGAEYVKLEGEVEPAADLVRGTIGRTPHVSRLRQYDQEDEELTLADKRSNSSKFD